MLNEAERVAALGVAGCLLVLGCQAFASSESDRSPLGPPPRPPTSSGPMPPPVSSEAAPVPGRTPIPQREDTDADGDAGIGTAPLPDAAPLTDAGALLDAAVDAG